MNIYSYYKREYEKLFIFMERYNRVERRGFNLARPLTPPYVRFSAYGGSNQHNASQRLPFPPFRSDSNLPTLSIGTWLPTAIRTVAVGWFGPSPFGHYGLC